MVPVDGAPGGNLRTWHWNVLKLAFIPFPNSVHARLHCRPGFPSENLGKNQQWTNFPASKSKLQSEKRSTIEWTQHQVFTTCTRCSPPLPSSPRGRDSIWPITSNRKYRSWLAKSWRDACRDARSWKGTSANLGNSLNHMSKGFKKRIPLNWRIILSSESVWKNIGPMKGLHRKRCSPALAEGLCLLLVWRSRGLTFADVVWICGHGSSDNRGTWDDGIRQCWQRIRKACTFPLHAVGSLPYHRFQVHNLAAFAAHF